MDGSPTELKSHGPDPLAAMDVLGAYITGLDGENPTLIQWVSNLIRAVEKALETEFHYQYMNYTRQITPLDHYLKAKTPREYWVKTGHHPDADVISYLGEMLFSLVSNSMAEEQTVSGLMKL
ncbi:hypothetical protein FRC11_011347, partial [Ceratobasidium sp. 423]